MISLSKLRLSGSKLTSVYGLLLLLSAAGYIFFFTLSRKHFSHIAITYTGLFVLFIALNQVTKSLSDKSSISWLNRFGGGAIAILFAGLIFRLAILFEVPNLSQDFFRFIWDGQQLLGGFNPYLYLPDDVIKTESSHIAYAQVLYENMGSLSAGNYTNYPPLNQLFFAASSYLGGDSLTGVLVWMRLFIIAADIGVFFIGIQVLKFLKLPLANIGLYFLNPFVIIELTGNLHWEGMMAMFLLLAFYLLLKNRWLLSSIAMASGVLVKLLPLIAIPVMFKRLGFSRWMMYGVAVGLIICLGFLPFVSAELIDTYSQSVGLWFGKFEFNASVYYLVRWVGFQITGYNIIQTAGKALPLITIAIVLLIAFLRKNKKPKVLVSSLLFSYFTYLLFSTTVHPWYLTIPLLLSVFTRYRFMLIWSLVVFLSYWAYSNSDYQENLILVALEYVLVVGYFVYEVFFRQPTSTIIPQTSIS